MPTLKQLARRPNPLTGGHSACAGCGFPQAMRLVVMSIEEPVVVASATGCMEVTTTTYPNTAWTVPFIHNAFENSAATISGVEAAYKALSRRGKVSKPIRFVAFGGDGGTYDIGLQSLSGAAERGHRFVYVCYDNQGYMNTGIQRSGATPFGASTTTTPAGEVIPGKQQRRKDMAAIMAAHNIPYVAQSTVGHWQDLTKKVQRAMEVDGPAYINVLAPCRLGWGTDPSATIQMCELAADTCAWPLFEVDHGQWKVTYTPKTKLPVEEYLKPQERFRHVFQDETGDLLRAIQKDVDEQWEALLARARQA